MRPRSRSLVLLLLAVLGPAPLAQAQTQTPDAWLDDLHVMVSELESRHANLYHTVDRDSFHRAADHLAEQIPLLRDDEVIAGLARLVARVGDGHTIVPLLWDRNLAFRRLPIELFQAHDGLLILAAGKESADLVGAQLLRIGRASVTEALDAVAPLISRDNSYTVRGLAPAYLVVPEILYALGLIENVDSVQLLIEDPGGRRRQVTLAAISRQSLGDTHFLSTGDSLPLWLKHREDAYWFTYLSGSRTVYLQYNRADYDKEDESVAEFGARLEEFVAGHQVERVVVDLRWNGGGSRWRARHLLHSLIRIEKRLGGERGERERKPNGKLFTIIGPTTFSAAMQFALDLDLHTNTAFVGLPTGGKPNHYGEVGRFRLPNSGLEVRYSVYYHQASHPRDSRQAIGPDRRVDLTIQDYRRGKDPALDAALEPWDG